MFSVIYSLFPLLLIPISMYLLSKRKSLLWDIKKGKICYNCKDDLNLSDSDLMKRIMFDTNHAKLCLSCSRDVKINSIRNPLINLKHKFESYLISKHSDKLVWYFTGAAVVFIILDIVLISFGIKIHLSLIYTSINMIFWIINIYKILYTTKKSN